MIPREHDDFPSSEKEWNRVMAAGILVPIGVVVAVCTIIAMIIFY